MRMLAQRLKAINSWRTQYNPLRGLDLQRAISLLEQGTRGEYADLMWTYEFIEQTDADLLALVERRTSSLLEMDWNIKTVAKEFAGYSQTLADDQAEELRTAYDRIDNLYEIFEHLEMAAFRGFSIGQPHTDAAGDVVHIEPLDHWNFVRNGRYGQWAWNPEARFVSFASLPATAVLDASQFMIRQVRRPIDRIGLIKFVRANLSDKDWDAFIELFGNNAAFIIGPEDVPSDKEQQYRDDAEDVAEGGGGYLPYGSDVKFANDTKGVTPFEQRMDFLAKKLVLAGTGGMLTMLTEAGSGTLAGTAHSDTFNTIARSEARKISELFQRGMDRNILDKKFPGRPRLAYFAIAAEEEQDIGELCDHFQKLSTAGLQIDAEDASERTGYKLVAAPRPAPGEGFAINRLAEPIAVRSRESVAGTVAERVDSRLAESVREELAKAVATDLSPVNDRIRAALALEDDQAMIDALLAIQAELPDMLTQMCLNPASEKIIEESLTAALFNGIAEGAAKRATPDKEAQ